MGAVLDQVTAGITLLPLSAAVATTGASFPDPFPRDPADRIIAATAIVEGVPLVTADEAIRNSGVVKTIW
jgi:PIN domain nuclease of toxin-antitoxin system